MLTLFQKAVLATLVAGFVVIGLVVSAKTSVASATLSGGTAPLNLVVPPGGPAAGITVVGEATLAYRPDVAHVTLGAVTQAPTAAAAQSDLAQHVAKILERAKGLGIADRDVANGGYSIAPQYAYEQGRAPRITGYQASQQVVLTLRDVSAVGKVLDALVQGDGATTASLRFGLAAGKDPDLDARARAIEDARAKAEAMAKAAGVRLGPATSISEISSPYPKSYDAYRGAAPVPAPSTQVPTGDVELVIRMQVQFGIVP